MHGIINKDNLYFRIKSFKHFSTFNRTMKKFQCRPSKKPFHYLSIRQQQRIRKIMKDEHNHMTMYTNNCNKKLLDNQLLEINKNNEMLDETYLTFGKRNNHTFKYFNNPINNDFSVRNSEDVLIDNDTDSYEECNTSDSESIEMIDNFKSQLASCFVENGITHVQGNALLKVLKLHPCFSYLPLDVRTLLKTPCSTAQIIQLDNGEYVYIGLKKCIIDKLRNMHPNTIPSSLEIDISTDGAQLHRNGNIQVWPIQCRVFNVTDNNPEIVGIYKGSKKPTNPNRFFEYLLEEIKSISTAGGIFYNNKKISITYRSFIADAPARAFLLNHKSHNSKYLCSKCKVSGCYINGSMSFLGINHEPRTDDGYAQWIYDEHHSNEIISPLLQIPIKMVSQVPFDYMHLVCLGVVKRLCKAWMIGNFTKLVKFSVQHIELMSSRLECIRKYCPVEFSRLPRSFKEWKDYKATEFRQFLIYTGPVVLIGILQKDAYLHFLLLHISIRILLSVTYCKKLWHVADIALKKFVTLCEHIYSREFISYNVHGLLHLTEDVLKFGSLDTISCFPFENKIPFIRKYIRKPHLPLQQFIRRISEYYDKPILYERFTNNNIRVSQPHECGPLLQNIICHGYKQYRKLQCNNIVYSLRLKNNCCLLKCSSLCLIRNILVKDRTYYFIVQKHKNVSQLYDVSILSHEVGIFVCSELLDQEIIPFTDVVTKCFRMPFFKNDTSNNAVCDKESEMDKYVIVSINV